MLVRAAEQSKRTFCIALYNRALHANNCCPLNYRVDYDRGWFTVQYGNKEPAKEQRPDITKEADKIMAAGSHIVGYSDTGNTFFLVDND